MGNCLSIKPVVVCPGKVHLILHAKMSASRMLQLNNLSGNFAREEHLVDQDTTVTFGESLGTGLPTWNLGFLSDELSTDKISLNFQVESIAGNRQSQKIKCQIKNNCVDSLLWELLTPLCFKQPFLESEIFDGDILMLGNQKIKFSAKQPNPNSAKRHLYELTSSMSGNFGHSSTVSDISFPKNMEFQKSLSKATLNSEKNHRCRICLEPETEVNSFHDLCNCSLKMPTHLSCLKQWISRNMTLLKTANLSIYNIDEQKCDVCRENLPLSFQQNGIAHFLLNIELPNKQPYFLLEIFHVKKTNQLKALIIGKTQVDQNYVFGKAVNSDIILNHNSVSNKHGFLKVKNKRFYFVDNNSENGTLRLVRFPTQIIQKNTVLYISGLLIEMHFYGTENCGCNSIGFKKSGLSKANLNDKTKGLSLSCTNPIKLALGANAVKEVRLLDDKENYADKSNRVHSNLNVGSLECMDGQIKFEVSILENEIQEDKPKKRVHPIKAFKKQTSIVLLNAGQEFGSSSKDYLFLKKKNETRAQKPAIVCLTNGKSG